MKMKKRVLSVLLALALLAVLLPNLAAGAYAKTTPSGQTVSTVLVYVTDSAGEQVLVSQIPVSKMESDLKSGRIDGTLHNYSLLDRYVTTVHQEAQGFTMPEFVAYAQSESSSAEIKSSVLSFSGSDVVRFWEIDQSGYDSYDTYTYNDLYGVARYDFPLLYEYWNYKTQDYYDPAGSMTRAQAIDRIFSSGVTETPLLAVRAFSQRYILTDTKYGSGDYNMENCWNNRGLLDNERALRIMLPMTKEELYAKTPTSSNSRFWISNILLNMKNAPDIKAKGIVAAPTATMTEDADYYYIRFSCTTKGASVYYNHNFSSPSYTPTCSYGGSAVAVPKSDFPDGIVTITAHAVKDGYADAGVVTLKLKSSGTEIVWRNPFSDVKSTDWYYNAVAYVIQKDLLDATTAASFSPNAPMTRAMLVTALYRLQGSPAIDKANSFSDVPANAAYASAVEWAYKNGIVSGISSSSFAPDSSITREQIAVMLMRYAVYIKADTSAVGKLPSFSDAGKISEWASQAVNWATGARLINGMGDGTVAPQGTATRAQMAKILLYFSVMCA